jgi:hypothetical protein
VVGAPREDARISDAQKNAERETTLQEKKKEDLRRDGWIAFQRT